MSSNPGSTHCRRSASPLTKWHETPLFHEYDQGIHAERAPHKTDEIDQPNRCSAVQRQRLETDIYRSIMLCPSRPITTKNAKIQNAVLTSVPL